MSRPFHNVIRYLQRARPMTAGLRGWTVVAALLIAATAASAQTLYWDANGTTAGAGNTGGTWSSATGAANRRWNSSSAGTSITQRWTSGADAVFSAGTDSTGSFTITVSGTQNVGSITVEEGNPTINSGVINFNSASPSINVASGSTLTVGSRITGATGLSKDGDGTLVLRAATNSWTGGFNINAGIVELAVSNVVPNSDAITIASGATLQIDSGISETLGTLSGSGSVTKLGTGTLTFNSSFNFSGDLTLGGGTVSIAGITANLGTLHITGNTVLDFGSSAASILTASTLIIDAGVTLTINNWTNATDYFYAQSWTGASYNTRGTTPMNQVTFSGFSSSTTGWLSFDNQITPVPEPTTYGAVFSALMLAWFAWRRRTSLV